MRPRIWRAVPALLRRIGQLQGWALLSAFYFLLLGPVALCFKLLADPLGLRRRSGWRSPPRPAERWTWARRQ
jgi:hypothetical protein